MLLPRYERRALLGLLLLLSGARSAQAQKASCTVIGSVVKRLMPSPAQSVPVGGNYYPAPLSVPERRLPSEAFTAHEGFFHHVPILSVERDDGPRRIVLMRTFTADWRTLSARGQDVAQELSAILSVARPEDSFALMAVGGPHIVVPFGSSREVLPEAIEALSRPDPNGPEGPDFLNGLKEATKLFGSPQIGDSILEFGDVRRWRWDKQRALQIRTVLISRGIRLFSAGGVYSIPGPGTDLIVDGDATPLAKLCGATGGGTESASYLGPNARDEMLREWRDAAKSLYDQAIFVYIFRLAKTGPRVQIQLTPAAKRLEGWPFLSYPNPLPVCPPVLAPTVLGAGSHGH